VVKSRRERAFGETSCPSLGGERDVGKSCSLRVHEAFRRRVDVGDQDLLEELQMRTNRWDEFQKNQGKVQSAFVISKTMAREQTTQGGVVK